MVGWIKMKLGMEVGLGSTTLCSMGTHLPSPKRGTAPNFGRCMLWQTAGWIKMPLATEIGLGPGNIVLDRDTAPPPQKGGGTCIVAKRLGG